MHLAPIFKARTTPRAMLLCQVNGLGVAAFSERAGCPATDVAVGLKCFVAVTSGDFELRKPGHGMTAKE